MKRFWDKVDRLGVDDCWNWNANVLNTGYGQFSIKGKPIYAHRFSWQLHNGEIPEGLVICHKCDNRKCVNPSHLFIGTQSDNMQDMLRKGRDNYVSGWKPLPGTKNPMAKLTEPQVIEIRNMKGTKTYKEIGAIYGITAPTVCLIMKRINWSHI